MRYQQLSGSEEFSGFVVVSRASPKCCERVSVFVLMPSPHQFLFVPYLPGEGVLFLVRDVKPVR